MTDRPTSATTRPQRWPTPGGAVTSQYDDEDEFGSYLTKSLEDPGFRAAYEDAQARSNVLNSLSKLRRCLHLTQTQVAARMQTTQSFVSELETGNTDPHLSTLQRYARAITARIYIKVEMPADGPWLPAAHGTYTHGSLMDIRSERSITQTPDFASDWREHALKAQSARVGKVEIR
jgi:transcriptional regulator with XRE-family HTH domain